MDFNRDAVIAAAREVGDMALRAQHERGFRVWNKEPNQPVSDIDLAVLASPDWDGRSDLEDSVRTRLGNDCDVLLFTPDEFNRLVASGEEPVVNEILADGVVLVGSTPQRKVGVA